MSQTDDKPKRQSSLKFVGAKKSQTPIVENENASQIQEKSQPGSKTVLKKRNLSEIENLDVIVPDKKPKASKKDIVEETVSISSDQFPEQILSFIQKQSGD